MFFLASAAGSALSYLSSLQGIAGAFQSSAAPSTGPQPAGQGTPFAPGPAAQPPQPPAMGGGNASSNTFPMSSQTMNTLLTAQSQAGGGNSLSQRLFSMLDANSDGTISKSEFETAFGQNGQTDQADAVFAKLDQDGDGAVSQKELTSALRKGRHHHAQSVGGASGGEAGGSSSKNATTQTTTNADGSTTTTISYADGTQVTMTMPAGGTVGGGNVLEQLIQRQSQMLSSSPGQSLAVNI